MCAAVTQRCVECDADSSKYKCPSCKQATCSLACSKQHKSAWHAVQDGESSSSQRKEDGEVVRVLPPLRIGGEQMAPLDAAKTGRRFEGVETFVPMNRYDETNMLEDMTYLECIGRSVSAIGRDIVKNGWLRAAERQSQQQQSQGQSQAQRSQQRPRVPERLPADARNRQQFESWIRKLRLPIMLLPDGMSARRENQTKFKANTRKLHCTVQITLPGLDAGEKSAQRTPSRIIVHHVQWDRILSDVVNAELKKRPSIGGKDPTRFAFIVALHSDRLRNETSAKFLEWWQRQLRNGWVTSDGLELDEKKREEMLKARKQTDWTPIEGLNETEAEAAESMLIESVKEAESASAQASAATPTGLIQAALLNRLQAQRAAREKMTATGEDGIDAHFDLENDMPPSTGSAPRQVLVLGPDDSIEKILRGLPKGDAIVEYPHVEVWDRAGLEKAIADGKLTEVHLTSDKDQESRLGKHPVPPEVDEEEAENRDHKRMRVEPSNTQAPSLGSGLTGLTAYDSSDEEEEDETNPTLVEMETQESLHFKEHDDDDEDDNGSNRVAYGGIADIARAMRMTS